MLPKFPGNDCLKGWIDQPNRQIDHGPKIQEKPQFSNLSYPFTKSTKASLPSTDMTRKSQQI